MSPLLPVADFGIDVEACTNEGNDILFERFQEIWLDVLPKQVAIRCDFIRLVE
jgi:hypothetical protein